MASNKKPYHHKGGKNPAMQVMKYYSMDKHIEEMFAAFAITLMENTNLNNDDVMELLASVQQEWNVAVSSGYNIVDKCYTEYDIDVRRKVNE